MFGLKRSQNDDWTTRAASARRERERAQRAPPRAIGHRLAIPAAVKNAIARRENDDADDDVEDMPDVPRLRAVSRERGVVLVGGVVKNEKLDRLRKHIGPGVEWIETDANGTKTITALERRIRDGNVGAVIILEELIGHKHHDPLVDAAHIAGTPVAYGRKAGKGSIAKALLEIEASLERTAGNGASARG